MPGAYVIFEGGDGVGKSTIIEAVSKRLEKIDRFAGKVVTTRQPGGTILGTHLRKLVKYPHQIDPNMVIDDQSRQILYMVDSIACAKQVIQPAIEAGKIAMTDRSSFVSSLVYGIADGLDIEDIDRLFSLYTPPKADRLYILQCPYNVTRSRLSVADSTLQKDHYDTKPSDFFAKIEQIYNDLLTGPIGWKILINRIVALENVKYIDSSRDAEKVAQEIADDIAGLACLA